MRSFSLLLLLLLFSQGWAQTDSNVTLESLQAQLTQLKKALQTQQKKLTLKTPQTQFFIGGRVRLDVVSNTPSVGKAGGDNSYDFLLSPTSVSGLDESGRLTYSSKDSRFWFKTRRDTEYGLVQTLIEVDFGGSAGNEKVTNSHDIRLRHAYVTLGGWTLGQTYSSFMGSGTTDTVQPSMDLVFARQPLIRYTKNYDDLRMEISFESPETTLTSVDVNGTVSTLTANDDTYPDITAKISYKDKTTELSLAALWRQISVEQSSYRTQNGYGLNLGGKIRTHGLDQIYFGLVRGKGLGRYLDYNFFKAGTIDSSESIVLQEAQGYHIAYQHWWNKKWRSSIVYGTIAVDNDTALVPLTTTESADSSHINLRYAPFKNALLTLEYIKANKVSEADQSDTLERAYFSTSYDF